MSRLTWKLILFNLSEAHDELDELHCRLHVLTYRELPDDCACKAWLSERDRRHPFTEFSLHARFDHAYHHLNFAWNVRRTPEKRAWQCATQDFLRWGRFPRTKEFADLWLAKADIQKAQREPGFGSVNFSLVHAPILLAKHQLGILCYLVAKECGENSRWGVRPDGLNEEVDAQPLTEREFACWMHSIYAKLNFAWNSRKDKTPVVRPLAVRRRRCFPPMFMPGTLTR